MLHPPYLLTVRPPSTIASSAATTPIATKRPIGAGAPTDHGRSVPFGRESLAPDAGAPVAPVAPQPAPRPRAGRVLGVAR